MSNVCLIDIFIFTFSSVSFFFYYLFFFSIKTNAQLLANV